MTWAAIGQIAGHRALVAAPPSGWMVLLGMLEDFIGLVPVHSTHDAMRELEDNDPGIDLIIATLAFDDSQMMEFLHAVKQNRKLSRIPFLCSRVFPSSLPDEQVGRMRELCRECDAVDLVDVARLSPREARTVLRAAVAACVASRGEA